MPRSRKASEKVSIDDDFLGPDEWSELQEELNLSVREREIVVVMCEGIKDEAMAQRLGMAKDTLRSHITRLHRKLGVSNRTQLLVHMFKVHLFLRRRRRSEQKSESSKSHTPRLSHACP